MFRWLLLIGVCGLGVIYLCFNSYYRSCSREIASGPQKIIFSLDGNSMNVSRPIFGQGQGSFITEAVMATVKNDEPGKIKVNSLLSQDFDGLTCSVRVFGADFTQTIDYTWGQRGLQPVFRVVGNEIQIVDWQRDYTGLRVAVVMFLLAVFVCIPVGKLCGDEVFGWASGI